MDATGFFQDSHRNMRIGPNDFSALCWIVYIMTAFKVHVCRSQRVERRSKIFKISLFRELFLERKLRMYDVPVCGFNIRIRIKDKKQCYCSSFRDSRRILLLEMSWNKSFYPYKSVTISPTFDRKNGGLG